MTPQEARERAAQIHADRAELPNDDCPLVSMGGGIWVDHNCGERGLEFVSPIA